MRLCAQAGSVLLAASPFLVDAAMGGGFPATPYERLRAALLSAVMLVPILLLRYDRRRGKRRDALRETLNETTAHDLNNSLSSIFCAILLMKKHPLDFESRTSLLSLAHGACQQQMRLINTMIDTAHLESGSLQLHEQWVEAGHLVRGGLESVSGIAEHHGVKLTPPAPGLGAFEVFVDHELLRRVMTNLLHNALKYTPRGGTVGLTIESVADGATLVIRDTGVGIAPNKIGQLFEKYYRVEGDDQSARRGSGLGLYFCKWAVEAHGGSLTVHSVLNRGTTFKIRLPGRVRRIRDETNAGSKQTGPVRAPGTNGTQGLPAGHRRRPRIPRSHAGRTWRSLRGGRPAGRH